MGLFTHKANVQCTHCGRWVEVEIKSFLGLSLSLGACGTKACPFCGRLIHWFVPTHPVV